MSSAFTPDSWYDKSIHKFIGNVYCQCVLIYFARRKRLFNLSADATINNFNAIPRVKWAIVLLKNNQIRFSRSLVKGFRISKRCKTQFQMFLKMFIVHYVQTKSVFTFQSTFFSVSMTVKTAKPALTC